MKLIAAADKNWAIGKDGELLVRISEDMKNFSAMTTGNVIVMGRKTLESFPGGKPLPNRVNIVLHIKKIIMEKEQLLFTAKKNCGKNFPNMTQKVFL